MTDVPSWRDGPGTEGVPAAGDLPATSTAPAEVVEQLVSAVDGRPDVDGRPAYSCRKRPAD